MVASLPAVRYAYAAYAHGGYGLSIRRVLGRNIVVYLIPGNQRPNGGCLNFLLLFARVQPSAGIKMVLHYSDELLIINKIAKSQPQWNA